MLKTDSDQEEKNGLICEAVERILDGRFEGVGVLAPGAAFDAADFLRALTPDLTVELARA